MTKFTPASELTRKEIVAQLKKFRSLGYTVNCKLNAKTEILAETYTNITYSILKAEQQVEEIEWEQTQQDSSISDYEVIEDDEPTHDFASAKPENARLDHSNSEQIDLAGQIAYWFKQFCASRPRTQEQFKLRKKVAKLQAKFAKRYDFFYYGTECRNYA